MNFRRWFRPGSPATDYEVFLNFRGVDVRGGFVDILGHFMVQSGIRFFYDDDSMHPGDVIERELMQSIENSHIYILILSERYAESKWCLRELTYMVMCQDNNRQGRKVILPVFYGVTVDNVKLRGGSSYSAALEDLRTETNRAAERAHSDGDADRLSAAERLLQEIGEWEVALRKVAAIKGLHFGHSTRAVDFSQIIVREVQSRLTRRPLSYHLIGVDEEAQRVEERLDLEKSDVRMLKILGQGGTGKTTLARAIFQRLSTRFQGCSFVTDVPEMKERYGYVHVWRVLLRDICGEDEVLTIDSELRDNERSLIYSEFKRIYSNSFRNRKVLIVLDGVDEWEQIKNLAGTSMWFGAGSRIVITTSNRNNLSSHGEVSEVRNWNPMVWLKEELNENQALTLFCRYAFSQDSPLDGFADLSHQIVGYCHKLPLLLEIMGSLLHRERNNNEWERRIRQLRGSNNIPEKLRISYDALNGSAKSAFLDIACFFANEKRTNPTYMWSPDCHENANGLDDLLMSSLIKIVDDDKLGMHEYLRVLGREIVCSSCRLERCRYWESCDAKDVLNCGRGTEKVEAICVYNQLQAEPLRLERADFVNMQLLRFLKLYPVEFVGDFRNNPPGLRWISWHKCPKDFRATEFASGSLVILDLAQSLIEDDWVGWRQLVVGNLRVMDLTSCEYLTATPSLSEFTHLERVVLENCSQLNQIDPSIGMLTYLRCLNIKGCDSLETLPMEICFLENLTEMLFSKKECGSFSLPNEIGRLKSLTTLEVVNVMITELPQSIGGLENLQRLSLLRCSGLYQLPARSIGKLRSLVELDISQTEITGLPDSIGNMKELKVLKMKDSWITELPRTIGQVKKLEELHAKHCVALRREVPDEIGELSHLKVLDLSHTSVFKLPMTVSRLPHLQKLLLPSRCKFPDWSQLPQSLTNLGITFPAQQPLPQEPNRFEGLPELDKLEAYIPNGTNYQMPLRDFAPHLKSLHVSCQDFQDLQCCLTLPDSLSELKLRKVKVNMASPHFDGLTRLSSLELHDCQLFDDISGGRSWLRRWRRLDFNASLFGNNLHTLTHFYASGCNFYINNELHLPQRLRFLHLTNCDFQSKVLHLSDLSCLKQLEVSQCQGLVQVQGLGELESLEYLKIHGCSDLERLQGVIPRSNRLKVYIVTNNNMLSELVRPSGRLKYCEITGRKLPSP